MPDFSFGTIFILLYLIFLIIGKFFKINVEKIFTACVLSIIFTVSFWGGTVIRDVITLSNVLFLSISYTLITLAITYLIGNVISKENVVKNATLLFNRTPIYFILVLVLGWLVGTLTNLSLPFDALISYELHALAILVGLLTGSEISLALIKKSGLKAFLSILTSVSGGILAGIISSLIFNVDLRLSLGITMGMGWYSFAGPVVAYYSSPLYGTVAFLSNFLREQLTIVTVPFLRGSNVSLISLGGATTMDDTLPILVATLGKQNSLVFVVNGLVLTILVALILPSLFLI
ncbi:MAG: lysine exporter LysO family protein [Thermoproteota archaeon]|jgi:Predicted membrane protein